MFTTRSAFKLKSTALVGTSPKVFGYRLHDNIEQRKQMWLIKESVVIYLTFNLIQPHECPYLTSQEMFDFNEVLSEYEQQRIFFNSSLPKLVQLYYQCSWTPS